MSSKTILLLSICLVVFFAGTGLYAQPLVHFTFNDGTTSDWSGNGTTGTLLGDSVIIDDAERGKVVQTNGRGVQAMGPFPFTTEFTLAVWYKFSDPLPPAGGRVFIGDGNTNWHRTDNQGGNLHHWVEFRYPGFENKFDTRTENNPDGHLDGKWHHYVWRLEEDGTYAMYFDGKMAPRRDDEGFKDSPDNEKKPTDYGGTIEQFIFGAATEAGTGGGGGIKGFLDNIRIYNYAVPEDEIPGLAEEGSDPSLASNPSPADEATDVARDTLLGWMPGINAVTNDVYLGMSFDEVNDASRTAPGDVLLAEDTLESSATPKDLLEFGKTYYWRTDGINADNPASPWKGNVWSFTVEPFAYPITAITASASDNQEMMGPEKTIDGSGLSADGLEHGTVAEDMWLSGDEGPQWIRYDFDQVYVLHELWIWNSNQDVEADFGLGAKDVTVEVSLDGEAWKTIESRALVQAAGTPGYKHSDVINLQAASAKALRINVASSHGGLTLAGLSEVRIFSLPLTVRKPSPANGAVDVDPSVVLGWRAGRRAVSHDVYLDSDKAKVQDGSALRQNVDVTRFDTSGLGLQLDQEYFWKINEVNGTTVWEGPVWSFTTAPCIVIDDMESYSNTEGNQLWATWDDGFEDDDGLPDNTNGSLVGNGNDGIPETGIVLSPRQSMPLYFDNSSAPTSFATRVFKSPQDWTEGGAAYLVINVYGDPTNTDSTLYASIDGERVDYAGETNPLLKAEWTSWAIDLSTLSVTLEDIESLAIGVDGAAAFGVVYVDDVLLYRLLPVAP